MMESVPDFSIETEMSTIGAMLLSEKAAKEIAGILKAEDFYRPAHRLMFKAILELISQEKAIEQITLEEQLKANRNLEDVGGDDYLLEVAMFCPSAYSAETYARIVKEKASLRADKLAARKLMQMAEEGIPAIEREAFKTGLVQSSETGKERAVFAHISDCENDLGGTGITTTWPGIDAMNWRGGFARGQVTVVKGESGKGKTSWAISTAIRLMNDGYSVLYATFADNTRTDINYRARRALTGFSQATDFEAVQKLELARKTIQCWDFDIYDAAEILDDDATIEAFSSWLKYSLRKTKYDVTILDYAQEIQSRSKRAKNHFEEQAEVARNVRILAQQTNVAAVVLSQVNADGQTSDSSNWHKICALELMIQNDGVRIDKNRFSGKTGMVIPHRFDAQRQIYTDR